MWLAYLLGIDLGAGSLKAMVIGPDGKMAGAGTCTLITHIAQPGWAEQDPADWWSALCQAVPLALAQAGITGAQVAGIGVTAGAHIPVLTDTAGKVLRPAILWSDQRAAAQAARLRAQAGDEIIRRGLNQVNAGWTLAMLVWLAEHEPAVLARTKHLYLAKDYLRFLLTGDWVSDYSDAIGALLADDATKTWSPELCRLAGWDMAKLPPLAGPCEVVGVVHAKAAAACGLAAGTKVVCGANDTTVEFFGAGAQHPGMAALKLASAGVLYGATEGPRVHPPVSCYPHIMKGLYYTATGTNNCAAAHKWLRDLMFPQDGFAEMEQLAAGVPAGAAGLLFHPYLQGERAPYWNADLRGDFIGLNITHNRAHFARALYEGIAFSLRDAMEAARALGLEYGTLRLLGGGAQSPVWRQIIADVMGRRVEVMENTNAAFGAALLAGIGVGMFADGAEAVARCVRVVTAYEPDVAGTEIYTERFEVYKKAQAALAGVG